MSATTLPGLPLPERYKNTGHPRVLTVRMSDELYQALTVQAADLKTSVNHLGQLRLSAEIPNFRVPEHWKKGYQKPGSTRRRLKSAAKWKRHFAEQGVTNGSESAAGRQPSTGPEGQAGFVGAVGEAVNAHAAEYAAQ